MESGNREGEEKAMTVNHLKWFAIGFLVATVIIGDWYLRRLKALHEQVGAWEYDDNWHRVG